MNKSKLRFAFLALGLSALLTGACAQDSADNSGVNFSQLSNGPDLPEECAPCWDGFQECFASGSDVEECGEEIIACTQVCQAPPPPDECLHCAAGFDACATTAEDNGSSGEDCAVGFEGCLSACETDEVCEGAEESDNVADFCEPDEPGPGNECDACESHYNSCIDESWESGEEDPNEANQNCELILDECHSACDDDPGDDPGNSDALCEEALAQCEAGAEGFEGSDGQFISCEQVSAECTDPGQGETPQDPPDETPPDETPPSDGQNGETPAP